MRDLSGAGIPRVARNDTLEQEQTQRPTSANCGRCGALGLQLLRNCARSRGGSRRLRGE